jgi:hypothetical protein
MDTQRDGWEAFERVRQTGRETGNDELEDFVPEQVQIRDGGPSATRRRT